MESTPEQVSEGRALVTVLACVLEKLIQANANSGVSEQGVVFRRLFFAFEYVFFPPPKQKLGYILHCEDI